MSYFAAAGMLWAAGTLTWQFIDTDALQQPFPGCADVAYFGTCACFLLGVFEYSATDKPITRLQICTFVLAQAAIAICIFFLLLIDMKNSALTGVGNFVAYLYPVVWGGAAAFATFCYFLYAQVSRRFTVGLLLAGLLSQGAADTYYALDLMGATYSVGSLFDGLWILAFLFVAWAAVEHLASVAGARSNIERATLTRSQQAAEAFIPATAILMVAASASATGVATYGLMYLWIIPPALILSISLGLRQHWSLRIERDLRMEATMHREEVAQILESTTDSVLVVDRDWRILYANEQAKTFIGQVAAFQIGVRIWDLYPDASQASFRPHYERAFETQQPIVFEEYVSENDLWVRIHAYPSGDRLSIFFRDVTEQRRTSEELEFLAHHDPLTGLDNRAIFQRRLDALLGDSNANIAVLWLDLDDFKRINDSLGHIIGDQFLIEIGRRIRTCVPDASSVARIGGDEFALILLNPRAPERTADDIIEALTRPIALADRVLVAGVSIGIAAPRDGNTSASELIKQADIALYEAKSAGRGCVRTFEPAMQTAILAHEARRIELGKAMDNHEFELVYQPIVSLADGRVRSMEALLRWRHPQHGVISPADFIPLAEETGYIHQIGEWVLREACREARNWPSSITVSVNLSPVQFMKENFLLEVRSALRDADLRPDRLELEITESVLLNDSDANIEILHGLRRIGVRIALDDFGTGYSSLAYIHKFPFSKIKIDRSFVSNLESRVESQAIVRCVAQLGHTLGVEITAEGVETASQSDVAREMGCTQAQGYLFSPPVAALFVLPTIGRLDGPQSISKLDPGRSRASIYARGRSS